MPVEFLGIATTSDASEAAARTTAPFDTDYLERLVRAHEDNGWTRVLFPTYAVRSTQRVESPATSGSASMSSARASMR